jgi:hydroxyacylglutathione hydrolase
MAAWTAAGYEAARIDLTSPGQLDGRLVLDIRQRSEYVAGHLPGAMHVELGEIASRADDLPDQPTVVMCGHGERAMGAASLLQRAGHHDLVVLHGGPQDCVRATGSRLLAGP